LVGRQEGHPARKKYGGWWRWALVSPDGVAPSRMVCLPLLISPCTIKSRSSLLAPTHLGSPGKRAVKQLCVCVCVCWTYITMMNHTSYNQDNMSVVSSKSFSQVITQSSHHTWRVGHVKSWLAAFRQTEISADCILHKLIFCLTIKS